MKDYEKIHSVNETPEIEPYEVSVLVMVREEGEKIFKDAVFSKKHGFTEPCLYIEPYEKVVEWKYRELKFPAILKNPKVV